MWFLFGLFVGCIVMAVGLGVWGFFWDDWD